MLDRFVFVYLGNILIFSKELKEHVQHMRVLQWLLDNQLFVKAEKFHAPSVSFLGFIIALGSIHMDPGTVSAVMSPLSPLRSLNYYLYICTTVDVYCIIY